MNFFMLSMLLHVCMCVCVNVYITKIHYRNGQTFLTNEINYLQFSGHLAVHLDSYYCQISFRRWLGMIGSAIPIPLPSDLSYAPAYENISEQQSQVKKIVLILEANIISVVSRSDSTQFSLLPSSGSVEIYFHHLIYVIPLFLPHLRFIFSDISIGITAFMYHFYHLLLCLLLFNTDIQKNSTYLMCTV